MCQICEELSLEVGDVIEVDTVLDPTVAQFYPQLRSGTRGVVVVNDDYFTHIPSMQCGDPKHKCVVWEDQDPMNVLVLHKKAISWRKKHRVRPRLK